MRSPYLPALTYLTCSLLPLLALRKRDSDPPFPVSSLSLHALSPLPRLSTCLWEPLIQASLK
jgi:hypothetical protein